MSDYQTNAGVPVAARVTGNRDLLTSTHLMKWAAQGKIFEAGQGLQTVGVDSQGEPTVDPDATLATFALVAPTATSPLIIPIMLRICTEVQGTAATDSHIIFTKAAEDCATDLVLSGRAMISIQNMNKGKSHTPQASALYGVVSTFALTVSTLVDADNVLYDLTAMAINNVTAPLTGASQQVQWNFLADGAPHIMAAGSAMIFYISSAGGDAKVHQYMQWAEVTEEDLV